MIRGDGCSGPAGSWPPPRTAPSPTRSAASGSSGPSTAGSRARRRPAAPYRADDPHLLGWIHVAEVDSFLTAFQVFGSGPLTPAEADDYVRQSGFVAEQLGVVDPPQTVADVDRLLADYRPELKLTPAA